MLGLRRQMVEINVERVDSSRSDQRGAQCAWTSSVNIKVLESERTRLVDKWTAGWEVAAVREAGAGHSAHRRTEPAAAACWWWGE